MQRARLNPFRVSITDAINYHFEHGSMELLYARLINNNWRCSIVGEHGKGKTTLLQALATNLASRGHNAILVTASAPMQTLFKHRLLVRRRLDDTQALPGWSDRNTIWLVDMAGHMNRLTFWLLRRQTRKAKGLIVTAHHPCALPTLYHCTTDSALLATIVSELLNKPLKMHEQAQLDSLWQLNHGNLRLCLRTLYDEWRE